MPRGIAGIVALFVAAGLPSAAGAETFDVTKKGDAAPGECTAGDCSLREAVLAANARPGADRIVLPARKGAYRLSIPSTGEDGAIDGDLDITNDPLALIHPGKGRATVDANGIDRAFHVFQGAPVKITKLEIRGGDNPSQFDGSGGGILSDADVTLLRSKLTANAAVDDGGGISIREGSGASLSITKSEVTRNVTGDDGGGIAVEEDFDGASTGRLVITRSKITRNEAENNFGGGVFVQRPVRIVKATIDRNRAVNAAGLGIETAGSAVIKDTSVTRNVAGASAGMEVYETPARLTNVTIAGNRAVEDGGGLVAYTSSVIRLNAVTIAENIADTDEDGGNEGGGILVDDASVRLDNTLLADNRLGALPDTCSGAGFASGGHNLADKQAASCALKAGKQDLLNKPAGIGNLGRNGGPTETVPLKGNSNAIGKAGADAPARDQRGVKRKDPDIGAFERR
jgi:CSLREA domain-containing protein